MNTKQILIIILCTFASIAFAGPKVEVLDIMHVTVDGVSKGTVVDAIANVPEARAAVLDWLLSEEKKRNKDHADKLNELEKAKEDAAAKADYALKVLRSKKAKEESTGKGKRWESLNELEEELSASANVIRKAELQARIDRDKEELKLLK